MNNQIKCKACGYILDEQSPYLVCPACGVPRTAFEPFTDKVSAKRRGLINLHLHPIAIHFPQAFAVTIPVLIVLSYFFTTFEKELISAIMILALLLPLSVLPALFTGLLDARTRFKKFSPPLIKRKIILGSLLFFLSLATALIVFLGRDSSLLKLALLPLSTACILCEIMLGQIGSRLMDAILPG